MEGDGEGSALVLIPPTRSFMFARASQGLSVSQLIFINLTETGEGQHSGIINGLCTWIFQAGTPWKKYSYLYEA